MSVTKVLLDLIEEREGTRPETEPVFGGSDEAIGHWIRRLLALCATGDETERRLALAAWAELEWPAQICGVYNAPHFNVTLPGYIRALCSCAYALAPIFSAQQRHFEVRGLLVGISDWCQTQNDEDLELRWTTCLGLIGSYELSETQRLAWEALDHVCRAALGHKRVEIDLVVVTETSAPPPARSSRVMRQRDRANTAHHGYFAVSSAIHALSTHSVSVGEGKWMTPAERWHAARKEMARVLLQEIPDPSGRPQPPAEPKP